MFVWASVLVAESEQGDVLETEGRTSKDDEGGESKWGEWWLLSRWCEGCGEDWGKREKVWGKQEEDASDEQGWRLFLNTTFNLELFKCRGKKKRYTTFNNSFFFNRNSLNRGEYCPWGFWIFLPSQPLPPPGLPGDAFLTMRPSLTKNSLLRGQKALQKQISGTHHNVG